MGVSDRLRYNHSQTTNEAGYRAEQSSHHESSYCMYYWARAVPVGLRPCLSAYEVGRFGGRHHQVRRIWFSVTLPRVQRNRWPFARIC